MGTIELQKTLFRRVGGGPKHSKSTRPALFAKFRSLSGEYLGNPWADFGSVNCVGKVFSMAWRKVLSDFWSDVKRTSYRWNNKNITRSVDFLHKLCKLGPWIGLYCCFYLGFVLWASIPSHRALIHPSTTIFSEVGNFDLSRRRPFWKWPLESYAQGSQLDSLQKWSPGDL